MGRMTAAAGTCCGCAEGRRSFTWLALSVYRTRVPCVSHWNLEGWFSCIHVLVYCGHLRQVVSLGGMSPSFEGLLITELRRLWEITGHWDLKLAGDKGGVCSIA